VSKVSAVLERDDDDRPIGRILRRREVLALLGASGLVAACAPTVLSGASPNSQTATSTAAVNSALPTATTGAIATTGGAVATPSCIVRPALTEGPYFVDEKLNRADVRSDPSNGAVKPGLALALTFNVSRVSSAGCAALQNAQVDIWHCDALGVYSDASDPSFNTKGQKFLRGYQVTDGAGKAAFTTIYPGWYQGRAVHIHFKIRTTAAGGAVSDFTSQLFFDDALNMQVFTQSPYSQKGTGWMKNAQDGIYTGGGDKLLLKPAQSGSGYAATFEIGLA
jgi:protocatechuate 3,4-dioxygenase beta subunit